MKRRSRSSNQGFAMLLVMIYIFLAVAVIATVSTAVISASRTTGNLDASRKALEAAEYGEVQAMMSFSDGNGANLGLADWRKLNEPLSSGPAIPRRIPAFGEPGVSPLLLAALPSAEYIAMTETPWHVAQNGGSAATVESPERQTLVMVYAAGRCGNAERRVEAVYRPVNVEKDVQSKRFTRISWRELPTAP